MEAHTRKLERIFDQTVTYQVPLFQRPYVWTKESNWQPLWEDILSLLDRHLLGDKVHPHFLGAVVLEQLANPAGSIESRQIIDGQQRFTTLQLFLIAARDLASSFNETKYVERFNDLVSNRRSKIDHEDEVYKVWPTNSNRAAFRAVHEANSIDNLEILVATRPELREGFNTVLEGYRFFHSELSSWLQGQTDIGVESLLHKTVDQRFDAIWSSVRESLQLVVIDLDQNDETQVIFETLNATGEDLLPADLIKNYLFRRAVAENEEVENLYRDHWQKFETPWWREEVKQGRLTRPRVDVFINYYLAMMTRDDVKSTHLFSDFKIFADKKNHPHDTSLEIPTSAATHIATLSRYADVYRAFEDSSKHPRLLIFINRLKAVDTTTVYPFLLYAYAALMPTKQAEFDEILVLLESYLMRRMICNLTGKNYNRFFVELIRTVDKASGFTAGNIRDYLAKSPAETSLFPSDSLLKQSIENLPLYGRLAQYKVRAILEALDIAAQTAKSELLPLPINLTIEHVMPQSWQTHWPLMIESIIDPETKEEDPLRVQKAIQQRGRLINTIGNLTLITGSLNPSLSNSSWKVKRPELLKFNKLNLTQYFHEHGTLEWDENEIEDRSRHFFVQLIKVWPAPPLPSPPATIHLTTDQAEVVVES